MANDANSKPGFGRIAVIVGAMIISAFLLSKTDKTSVPQATGSGSISVIKTETYRLMQALGNTEKEAARGLSKAECEDRKKDLKGVSSALGTYNEAISHGSITCLPESSF